MRLVLAAAVVLAALAGCNATMPQQNRPTAADDPSNSCFRGILINPQLAAIAGKIPLGNPQSATIEMLSDKGQPTEPERQALSLWAKYRAECADAGRSFRARYAPPGWAAAFDRGQTGVTQLIANLYSGATTYGQFNTERQNLAVRTTADLDAASRGAQQAEAAQQAQAQNAAVQNLQMMQLLQSMQPKPQPLPMPSMIQPTVNCISRPSIGSVYTTCN